MSALSHRMQPLCADGQLRLERLYPSLIPEMTGRGLPLREATALAYNTALLYLAMPFAPPLSHPAQVLDRLTLGEIAGLCEEYEKISSGEAECGFNPHFEEGIE